MEKSNRPLLVLGSGVDPKTVSKAIEREDVIFIVDDINDVPVDLELVKQHQHELFNNPPMVLKPAPVFDILPITVQKSGREKRRERRKKNKGYKHACNPR